MVTQIVLVTAPTFPRAVPNKEKNRIAVIVTFTIIRKRAEEERMKDKKKEPDHTLFGKRPINPYMVMGEKKETPTHLHYSVFRLVLFSTS